MARVCFFKIGQVVRIKGHGDELFVIEGTKLPEKIKPFFKRAYYHLVTDTGAEYVFPENDHTARRIEMAAEYFVSDMSDWLPAELLTRVRGPKAWLKKLSHWWVGSNAEYDEEELDDEYFGDED